MGKSSLINMLTHNRKLAKTSATPGKTLLINHFLIRSTDGKSDNEWYLVDLPGYGFAQRSKTQRDKLERMITGYILQREQMLNLFLLIDSRLKPQKIDLEFMEWLGESGVPFSIVFTKADKLSSSQLNANISAYLKQLSEQWDPLPPHFITSSSTKLGREQLLAYIEEINKNAQQK